MNDLYLPVREDCHSAGALSTKIFPIGKTPTACGARRADHRSSTPTPLDEILPGCSRILKQNDCAVTECLPSDPNRTTAYPLPAGMMPPIGGIDCLQFNGCPAEYPVVFCTTHFTSSRNLGSDYRIDNALFKAFVDGLPPVSGCPAGQTLAGGTCVCPAGKTSCGVCVDIETDPGNCGACGWSCAMGATCEAGVCACPAGQNACGGARVDERTDTNNCGG